MSAHLLVFPPGVLREMRKRLLAHSPVESAAFVFASPVRTPSGAMRLIARDVMHLDDADYMARTPTRIELRPDAVARAARAARDTGRSIFLVHTHPFADQPEPSAWDVEGEARLIPALVRRVPDIPHGRLILGTRGYSSAIIAPTELPLRVLEAGDMAEVTPTDAVDDVHHRQVLALGHSGQASLRAARIAVVGAGGTGSVVVQQLAHLGIGHIAVVDPDVIEITNLNRVVGAGPSDVGTPKVHVAERVVRHVNPSCRVTALQGDVCDSEVARTLLDADFFFCCTDSHGSRAVINQLAYQYLLHGIDLGVAIDLRSDSARVAGRVQALGAGLPCLVCAGVLDPEQVRRDLLTPYERARDPYVIGAPVAQPAVISINSVASSFAVTMMLSMVAGFPAPARNQQIRFEVGVVRAVAAQAEPGCPVCSARGAFARGDEWSAPGRPTGGAG